MPDKSRVKQFAAGGFAGLVALAVGAAFYVYQGLDGLMTGDHFDVL